MINITRTLHNSLAAYGSQVLFIDANGCYISYDEVLNLSESTPFLCTRRTLVFCLINNDINGLAGYVSLMLADAVLMMLQPNIHDSTLRQFIEVYKPNFLWLPATKAKDFNETLPLFALNNYFLLDLRNPGLDIHKDLSLLLGTSGSTGSPKFVRLSHNNVLSNALSISDFLELTADEIPITTMPPSYTYGLSIIHSHMLVGSKIAVTNLTFFDRDFWVFLKHSTSTSLAGVPYHYEILRKLRFNTMDLPSLLTLTQAGGKMNEDLTRFYGEYCAIQGKRFFTMYGQTEATARMSYLPANKAICKAGSIGIAIPGGKFWLENEFGQVIEEQESSGELVFEGENVSLGYATGLADLALGDDRNGVLRTGDVAKRDSDGYYYIVGRINRFIKLFGRRINMLDVEMFLAEDGYVAACVGQDDCLEIYTSEITATEASRIKTRLVDHLQIAVKAIEVYKILELPRNDSGKVKYAELMPDRAILLA